MRISNKVLGISSKLVYKLKGKSPTIFLVGGIVGVGVATVMACRATLKVHDKLDEDISKIEEVKETYPDDRKLISRAYADTGMDLVKAYAGPAILLALSIGCICKGHKALLDRNTALVGAYKLLEKGYDRYRGRVVEKYGEEIDNKFYHNIYEGDVEIEEDGKTKKVKNADILDESENPLDVSYDRVFDESNENYSGHPDIDIMFLKNVQNWANEVLNARGFIFLNEVYNELGFGQCEAGQFVGWIKENNGDGYVDFGIMDIYKKANRDFINGHIPNVLLTFNVDGYIADKI